MPAKSEGAGEEGGGLDPGGGWDAGSWAATPASRPRAAPTQGGGARRAPTPAAALDADRLARVQGWAPEGGDSSPATPAERRPPPEAARLDAAPGAPDGVRTSPSPRWGGLRPDPRPGWRSWGASAGGWGEAHGAPTAPTRWKKGQKGRQALGLTERLPHAALRRRRRSGRPGTSATLPARSLHGRACPEPPPPPPPQPPPPPPPRSPRPRPSPRPPRPSAPPPRPRDPRPAHRSAPRVQPRPVRRAASRVCSLVGGQHPGSGQTRRQMHRPPLAPPTAQVNWSPFPLSSHLGLGSFNAVRMSTHTYAYVHCHTDAHSHT
ncbi:unnamed protein product [Rangifer tarandus platyrhynchus]|uniref:Basic proline-rich protein-like n=1 Tax=Rangifer tarandus platyrhynchus TaxID=3082113 RepID=A0ABN8Y2H9_RANTA|nr:unnamed protein product [Rangifer tarandus platyrhynchus]